MSRAMLIKALTKQIFKRSSFEHILPRILFSFNLYSYLLIPLRKMWENWRSSIHLLWTNTCSVKLKFCYSCIRHLSGTNRRIKLPTSTCSCEYINSNLNTIYFQLWRTQLKLQNVKTVKNLSSAFVILIVCIIVGNKYV
jgi:hypothetical protein